MIANRPQEHGAAIRNLADHRHASNYCRGIIAVGAAILLAPQEHVAGYRSHNPSIELSVFTQEGDGDIALTAQLHERRAARDLPKADDAAQRVDGNA